MGQKDLTWDELIARLVEIFEQDTVNIEEVEEVMASYKSNRQDWKKFAKHDKYKYTRNLVHEGNGKFNLMLLCWAEGNQSAIHDHANAHCFVKILEGTLREVSGFLSFFLDVLFCLKRLFFHISAHQKMSIKKSLSLFSKRTKPSFILCWFFIPNGVESWQMNFLAQTPFNLLSWFIHYRHVITGPTNVKASMGAWWRSPIQTQRSMTWPTWVISWVFIEWRIPVTAVLRSRFICIRHLFRVVKYVR